MRFNIGNDEIKTVVKYQFHLGKKVFFIDGVSRLSYLSRAIKGCLRPSTFALSLCLITPLAHAADWNNSGTGDWLTPSNWVGGTFSLFS